MHQAPFFFVSYARADARDGLLTQFFDAVREEVGLGLGRNPDEVMFSDVTSVSPGKKWDDEIATALATCSAMVCVHTPTYFTREACGKEYAAFRSRVADYRAEHGLQR